MVILTKGSKEARRTPPRRALAAAALVAAGLASWGGAAHAIPSPELVIGTLSSVSQVFAVVSALLGGGAIAAGVQVAGRPSRASRLVPWLVAGLGLTALLALAGLVHLYTTHAAGQRARLEATLLRPAMRGPDGKLLDPALRELSFADQTRHPKGISTEDAFEIVSEKAAGRSDEKTVLIDIRESAEAEMGTLPGALKIRYPDLDAAAVDVKGKTALLFCHNGNRSGETCARLGEKGIDCRFIVGGLEKWLAEGRALGAGGARSLADLRALPDYPNKRTLLDTSEVATLVREQGAIFVDVRYPGEFASGHLDGAINLPMRPLPTAELRRQLDALPPRPVIAPCYDRRSCFFGELLGLELTRRGRDFRGRYTVPWDYFEAPPRSPYVAQLMEIQSRGWWGRMAAGLADLLDAGRAALGLPLAILALAMASRLLVLPFSLKAERDQRAARAMAPEVARLKSALADDPVRRGRALQALYARHGLTPGRNLVALLFLPLMALSVEAVGKVAAAKPEPLLWMPDLSAADPWLALPGLFGVLAAIYMSASLATTRRHHLLIWLVAAPLLALAVALLPAGGALYVVFSMSLLLLQRWLAGGGPGDAMRRLGALRQRVRRWRLGHGGLLPLEDVAALGQAGNKARRLGEMQAMGIAVPRGLVLSAGYLAAFAGWDGAERRRSARRIWRHMGAGRVAVRSSAEGEDGAEQSFAGVFETYLDVDRAGFEAAVSGVLGSFADPRVAHYAAGGGGANILVQPMIAARYAGVLFTEDPATAGAMLLEFVEGTGDGLVSGRVHPVSCRFGRVTGARLAGPPPPFDAAPLIALARRIEQHFGAPQDIEWAFAGGGFVILQSRDITAQATAEGAAVRAEWQRLLRRVEGAAPEAVVLTQTEMSELLPRPTPLSLSLVEALWAPGGSVDLAARRLGLAYRAAETGEALHATVFGRLYADARQVHARGLVVNKWQARRLRKGAREIERQVRGAVVPQILARQGRLAAMDYHRLSTRDLLQSFARARTRFVTETHVEAEIVNIAAGFLMAEARAAVSAAGLDMAAVAAGPAQTAEQQAIRAALLAPAERRKAALLGAIGHRAALEYELAQPRYGENPAQLEAVARASLTDDWEHLDAAARQCGSEAPPAVRAAVARARRFEVLKEDAKHHMLRELAELRRLLLAMDARFGLEGQVFELTLDEIAALDPRGMAGVRQQVTQRRAERLALDAMPSLPRQLTPREIEAAAMGLGAARAGHGHLAGTRVAGSGIAEGRALVVPAAVAECGGEIAEFADGDIIVTRLVPPSWLPYVLRSGGVVTEVGGWLSHMAIVARERGVVMVVGCEGIDSIVAGSRLRLHPDGRIEVAAGGAAAAAGDARLAAE